MYWWPVFNLLEEAGLPVTLVNARHHKQDPGRKTDVGDATWLADLCRHGLVRASFIPPAEIRALRELTRYRATQVQGRAREVQHLIKTLKSANLQLDNVASDVVGASGQQMLAAIAAGEDDPRTLAQMAKAGLRKKLDELEHALSGRIKPHHRLLIQESLHLLRYLEGSIERLDLEIERLMAPYAAQQAALDAVPGLGAVAVAAVVAAGRVSVPATSRVAANACPARPPKATSGSAASSVRRPGRRSSRRAPASVPATTVSSPAWVPSRPWWRSCTNCSRSSTTSSRPENSIKNSVPTIRLPTSSAHSVAWQGASNATATS